MRTAQTGAPVSLRCMGSTASLRWRRLASLRRKRWRREVILYAGRNKELEPITLTIELPDDLEAALKAHARAQGVTAIGYAQRVLQKALIDEKDHPLKAKKISYGILAKYGPGPSEQDIDENRREMFRSFAEDAP